MYKIPVQTRTVSTDDRDGVNETPSFVWGDPIGFRSDTGRRQRTLHRDSSQRTENWTTELTDYRVPRLLGVTPTTHPTWTGRPRPHEREIT